MRAHAVGSPARLNVRDNFALKPGQIGKSREEHEQHHDDFWQRDDDDRMLSGKLVHGRASASTSTAASGREFIVVQYRPRVPLVNKVSCAEKIAPPGTSPCALPLPVEPGKVGSASPRSSVGMEMPYPGTDCLISSNAASGVRRRIACPRPCCASWCERMRRISKSDRVPMTSPPLRTSGTSPAACAMVRFLSYAVPAHSP